MALSAGDIAGIIAGVCAGIVTIIGAVGKILHDKYKRDIKMSGHCDHEVKEVKEDKWEKLDREVREELSKRRGIFDDDKENQ